MNSNRKIAITVGLLILTSTATFMIGSGLLGSVLNSPHFLDHLDPNKSKVIGGVFFELMTAVIVVGIAWSIFPILKQHDEATALGYFGTRVVESVLIIVSVISPLVLLALSQEFIHAGASGKSYYQTIANIAIHAHYLAFDLAMFALSLGSLMFCYLLYQSKLVPRLISVIGLMGYTSLLASSCLGVIGLDIKTILYLPGALFELIFPIWLIIKGFNETRRTSER
ncbi:DUF4386 domain-containing protein [Melghirimyces algeriensis]|uniref:DUF4386 domain-containing protein n=1 Tax=Melghirimyces algeriensis TaxID=910412 RepID=A0A521BF71_9BACL|nr:DUF4386 domain-containing protein [Melghirimyces algeriensis]SMO45758.1 protein of unknown function [Melghirimyces algeriensis]